MQGHAAFRLGWIVRLTWLRVEHHSPQVVARLRLRFMGYSCHSSRSSCSVNPSPVRSHTRASIRQ